MRRRRQRVPTTMVQDKCAHFWLQCIVFLKCKDSFQTNKCHISESSSFCSCSSWSLHPAMSRKWIFERGTRGSSECLHYYELPIPLVCLFGNIECFPITSQIPLHSHCFLQIWALLELCKLLLACILRGKNVSNILRKVKCNEHAKSCLSNSFLREKATRRLSVEAVHIL